MTAPSAAQDELTGGIEARREAEPLSERRRVAGYAVAKLESLKRRLTARPVDRCRAGGTCRWHPAVKSVAEKNPWPPGQWERCAGCGLYRRAE